LNAAAQEEELMVLDAIFGEDLTLGEPPAEGGGARAMELRVACEGREPVLLKLCFPPEYPSHLPPTLAVAAGIDAAAVGYVSCSLLADFFTRLGGFDEGGEPGEEPEGTVHPWSEWLNSDCEWRK
jgi:hypothetical protein